MKKLVLVMIMMAMFFLVFAKHSDSFLNGVYSQLDLQHAPDANAVYSNFGQLLNAAGFNAASIAMGVGNDTDSDINKLQPALTALDDNSIDAVLSDYFWTNSASGITNLSCSNYLKMEAEYNLKYDLLPNGDHVFSPDVLMQNGVADTGNDKYNSVFKHDTGRSDPNIGGYSNNYAWMCNPNAPYYHVAGLALYCPRFRWKPDYMADGVTPCPNPRYIGYDLKFKGTTIGENKLYLSVALKWDVGTTNADIATISLKVMKSSVNDLYGAYDEANNYDVLTLIPVYSTYSTTITNDDYADGEDIGNGFRLFEYYVDLPPAATCPPWDEVLVGGYFKHINPQIYWCGLKTLYIDYITLEDKFHRSMRLDPSNSAYLTRLGSRLTQINNLNLKNNVAFYYTYDEPFQGQFNTYKLLQDYMDLQGKKIITAIHIADETVVKPDSHPAYYHPGLFASEIIPKRILMDAYPFKEWGTVLTQWNSLPTLHQDWWVQNRIQNMVLGNYLQIANLIHHNSSYSDTDLLFCPQIWGEYASTSTGGHYWRYITPPRSMLKCLQFLPLCYGADGIFGYRMTSNRSQVFTRSEEDNSLDDPLLRNDTFVCYAPLAYDDEFYTNLQDPEPPNANHRGAYTTLKDANQKINLYGPIIKELTWVNADSIMVGGLHPEVNMSELSLQNLVVNNTIHTGDYEGYVQCGYYHDNANNPSFMLVNRRAVHRSDNATGVIPPDVDNSFTDADPQTVQFTFTTDAVARYGGRLGLYDPYSNDLQVMNTNRVVNCTIDAGDGSLRQVVAVLQPNVTANYSVDSGVFVTGDVHIQNGAEVTIHPGRTLNILNHSRIYVQNGSTLYIAGNHFRKSKLIADLAGKIYVSQGGALVIQDTECDMSDSTFISLIGGELSINNSQFNLKCGGNWKGITSNGSHINISSSTIYKAEKAFSLNGSSFAMENTDIYIPTNGTGIEITNRHSSDEIILSGLEEYENHIQGQRETTRTTGISMKSTENPLSCAWTVFSNLTTGIEYSLSADKADSVTACSFTGCRTGIFITGTGGLAKIRQCNFTISNQGLGIDTHVYIPLVDACDFESPTSSNNTGIYLDNVQTISGQRGKENIRNCTFTALKRAIESRGSQARLEANYLNCNESGIVSHQNSLIDCSYDASNVFNNIWQNVYFYADSTYANATYCSTIEMLNGHNDFIHAGACYDFRFSTNYDYHGLDRGHIRASGNYWSLSPILGPDDNAVVYSPEHHDVIDVGNCDPAPNMLTAFATPSSRYEQALAFEDANDCTAAFLLYKQILSERLPDEKAFWDLCIPSIFKIAKQANLNLDELIAYYDLEISATSPEDSIGLIRLMKAYQANTYLAQKDYQAATDIIKERIANPISEADSLEAVMDMEIVYILRDLDESKRPLITSFSQYHYPDLQTYKVKHEENRLKLDALYDIQEETPSSIPTAVYLSRNYPNPFNPTTTIEFGVPKAAKVLIRIYNIRGQLVKELVNQKYEPGKFKVVWEGKNSFGKPVATGVYFYRLEAGGKCFTHKMLMLK